MQDGCKICGNQALNEIIPANEMMLGSGDVFNYLHCYNCQCLQLVDMPDDMVKYYPEDYYSFEKLFSSADRSGFKKYIRHASMRCHLGEANLWDNVIGNWKKIYFDWLLSGLVTLNSKILDVGCGNGFLIREMRDYGFNNLCGIDPFVGDDAICNDGSLRVLRAELGGLEEDDYDLIMLHHSFEHVENPLQLLKSLYDRVSQSGTVLIRAPLANSFAFRKYKQFWVQLDAPRHIFVHSVSSISKLSSEAGFAIQKIVYDSNGVQFTGSECYSRNISLSETSNVFSNEDMIAFTKEAVRLNSIQDGDQACFYLKAIK